MSRFEIKIVAALLLIAVIPLGASVVLVDQVIRVSESVAEGQNRRLAEPLARAAGAYRSLFQSRKQSLELRGELLALDEELRRAAALADQQRLGRRLAELVAGQAGLAKAAVVVAGQRVERVSPKMRGALSGTTSSRYRRLQVSRPLGGGARVELTFLTSRQPFDDFQALGRAQRATLEITSLRGELASYYRVVFLTIFGAVLLIATVIGIVIARRTTRKVTVLVRATREVAGGDLETRVAVRGKDELSELASSFNEMVGQLRESRERIGYLEKIGAWQEIARRLAHEIKNPLTPIQLAVQQLHQKYPGGDERFSRMLDDARDIITEEVEGLRRLVQAFSSFARLPNVRPEPVAINSLVDDFLKSHVELTERLGRLDWTPLIEPCDVLVDRMLIKHVLFNLVENALQAAEERGTAEDLAVTISARPDLGRRLLAVTVADNGPGMPRDVIARVFDPYFTTKERGTGLGLAIVKKIILEHGGTIVATSEVDQGSRLTITLPLVLPVVRQESALRTTLSRLLGAKEPPAKQAGAGEEKPKSD